MTTSGLDHALAATGLDPHHVRTIARATLTEDLQWGPDVTSEATLPPHQTLAAHIVARESGIMAGLGVAAAVVEECAALMETSADYEICVEDGTLVQPGTVVLRIAGPARLVLTAERSLLNLVSQLSGVATATSRWVQALVGTGARVRDTRKTVPGLRILQKYAVRCGGGENHRMGLGDAALIKDNHIAAAGSITRAFAAVRSRHHDISIEVECDTLDQVRESLAVGAELILLDNMPLDTLRKAVALRTKENVRFEASGGLQLSQARAVGLTGVDYLAVGALTHSSAVLDLGCDVIGSD